MLLVGSKRLGNHRGNQGWKDLLHEYVQYLYLWTESCVYLKIRGHFVILLSVWCVSERGAYVISWNNGIDFIWIESTRY